MPKTRKPVPTSGQGAAKSLRPSCVPFTLHKVTVGPITASGYVQAAEFVAGTSDGDGVVATTCGCLSTDQTGKPSAVDAVQYNGRVLLSWVDQSYCESGFSITRNGRGFTSNYAFVAPKVCGEVHAPETIYDDLTSQPSEPNTFEIIGGDYTWPRRSAAATKYARLKNLGPVGRPNSVNVISRVTVDTIRDCMDRTLSINRIGYVSPFGDKFSCAHVTSNPWQNPLFVPIFDNLPPHDLIEIELPAWVSSGVTGTYLAGAPITECEALCAEQGDDECQGVAYSASIGCTTLSRLARDANILTWSPDSDIIYGRRVFSMPVGSIHTYCVTASNPVGYTAEGYSSNQVGTKGESKNAAAGFARVGTQLDAP